MATHFSIYELTTENSQLLPAAFIPDAQLLMDVGTQGVVELQHPGSGWRSKLRESHGRGQGNLNLRESNFTTHGFCLSSTHCKSSLSPVLSKIQLFCHYPQLRAMEGSIT